jgi:hypothetical protein
MSLDFSIWHTFNRKSEHVKMLFSLPKGDKEVVSFRFVYSPRVLIYRVNIGSCIFVYLTDTFWLRHDTKIKSLC